MAFSLRRFYYLFRNELANQLGVMGIGFAAKAGVLLLCYLATSRWPSDLFHAIFFWVVLYVGGFLFSSRTFYLLNHPQDAYAYLLLPASTFEKWLVKWLLSSIGYLIFLTAAYGLFSVGAHYLSLALFGSAHPFFDPFTDNRWEQFGTYMTLQLFFLVAGLFIKRLVFLKTLLMILSVVFVAFTCLLVITHHFLSDLLQENGKGGLPLSYLLEHMNAKGLDQLSLAFKIFFFGFTLPYFWFLGFTKLKEKEIIG